MRGLAQEITQFSVDESHGYDKRCTCEMFLSARSLDAKMKAARHTLLPRKGLWVAVFSLVLAVSEYALGAS